MCRELVLYAELLLLELGGESLSHSTSAGGETSTERLVLGETQHHDAGAELPARQPGVGTLRREFIHAN